MISGGSKRRVFKNFRLTAEKEIQILNPSGGELVFA